MSDQNKNLRYEYKMTADNRMLHEVLAIVRKHPALFYRQYPNRIVNNVYFDTPGFTSYLNHTSGAAVREKTRIRWYGCPDKMAEKPVLERKFKTGQIGGKLSEHLSDLKLDQGGPWPIPGKALSESNNFKNTAHWRLRGVQPVVALRYERNYFISADKKYRVTVDSALECCGLTSKGISQMKSLTTAPIIIEVKYNPEFESDASDITNNFPFRITRFSKYIFAIDELKIST